ncbi:MAG: orotidine 5'-phosphate decarboxylase / HUMPS family protein [Smithellaceae bacterium]
MIRLIVAVDGMTFQEAKDKGVWAALSDAQKKDLIWGVKINDMLFGGDPMQMIASLKNDFNLGVMADVKLHDIPVHMESSMSRLVDAGADIVTVHCSANFRPQNKNLLKYIAGVTALTSFTDLEVKWIYDRSTEEIVRAFSDIALMNGYSYIVGSVKDLGFIKDNPLKKISTGIRPLWHAERYDQVRIATLKDAVRSEADYIVLGRPILKSASISGAIEKISAEIS